MAWNLVAWWNVPWRESLFEMATLSQCSHFLSWPAHHLVISVCLVADMGDPYRCHEAQHILLIPVNGQRRQLIQDHNPVSFYSLYPISSQLWLLRPQSALIIKEVTVYNLSVWNIARCGWWINWSIVCGINISTVYRYVPCSLLYIDGSIVIIGMDK